MSESISVEYQCTSPLYVRHRTCVPIFLKTPAASQPRLIGTLTFSLPWPRKTGSPLNAILGGSGDRSSSSHRCVSALLVPASASRHSAETSGMLSSSSERKKGSSSSLLPLFSLIVSSSLCLKGNQPHIPTTAAKGSPCQVKSDIKLAAQLWLRPHSTTLPAPTAAISARRRPCTYALVSRRPSNCSSSRSVGV